MVNICVRDERMLNNGTGGTDEQAIEKGVSHVSGSPAIMLMHNVVGLADCLGSSKTCISISKAR